MRVDHTLRPISAVTATSAAAGYPAANLALSAIERPWRSASTGAQTLVLDLGSSAAMAALWVQHTNISSATVEHSPDNSVWTAAGTLTVHTEQNGRAKGVLLINATARYVRLTIAAGSPGEGYWWVGSAFVFAETASLVSPAYGFSYETIYPQISRILANGRPMVARSGPHFTRLSGQFTHFPDEDIGVIRRARASGVIGLDLEVSTREALKWVCEAVDNGQQTTIENLAFDQTSFSLIEVV